MVWHGMVCSPGLYEVHNLSQISTGIPFVSQLSHGDLPFLSIFFLMGKVSKWTISTAMNCLLEGCYIPSTSFHHLPFETNGFATQGSSRPSNLPRRPHTMQSQTRNLGSSKGWAGLGTLHSSNLTVSIYIYIMRKSEPGHAGPSIFSANSGRLAN